MFRQDAKNTTQIRVLNKLLSSHLIRIPHPIYHKVSNLHTPRSLANKSRDHSEKQNNSPTKQNSGKQSRTTIRQSSVLDLPEKLSNQAITTEKSIKDPYYFGSKNQLIQLSSRQKIIKETSLLRNKTTSLHLISNRGDIGPKNYLNEINPKSRASFDKFVQQRQSFLQNSAEVMKNRIEDNIKQLDSVEKQQSEHCKIIRLGQQETLHEIKNKLKILSPDYKPIFPDIAITENGRVLFSLPQSKEMKAQLKKTIVGSVYYRRIKDPLFK